MISTRTEFLIKQVSIFLLLMTLSMPSPAAELSQVGMSDEQRTHWNLIRETAKEEQRYGLCRTEQFLKRLAAKKNLLVGEEKQHAKYADIFDEAAIRKQEYLGSIVKSYVEKYHSSSTLKRKSNAYFTANAWHQAQQGWFLAQTEFEDDGKSEVICELLLELLLQKK